MNELFYIYKITNNITGENYIGQHMYYDSEYYNDIKHLVYDGYWGSGPKIQEAIEYYGIPAKSKKYGISNFTKEILVSRLNSKEAANEAEHHYILLHKKLGQAQYNERL